MSKNYQMSDFMKAAIVNSLLTVILINVSFVVQYNKRQDAFNKHMQRAVMEQNERNARIMQEAKMRTPTPISELSRKPQQGPQPFVPVR